MKRGLGVGIIIVATGAAVMWTASASAQGPAGTPAPPAAPSASAQPAGQEAEGRERAARNEAAAQRQLAATKAESENAVALAKSGRLLRFGVTAGVAFTVQTPFFSTNGVSVDSPRIAAMPYLAVFPAYWGGSDARRVYCAASGWLESEETAKRAAVAQSRLNAKITFEKIQAYANRFLLQAKQAGEANLQGQVGHALWYAEHLHADIENERADVERRKQAKTDQAAFVRCDQLAPTTPGWCVATDRAWMKETVNSTEQVWLIDYLRGLFQKAPRGDDRTSTLATQEEAEANQQALVNRIAEDSWTSDDRGKCGWHRFGLFLGRPFEFNADVEISGSRASRAVSPVVSFGGTLMPNGYFSLLVGVTVNTVSDGTAGSLTRTAWTGTVGLGGTLDLVRLFTP
ncbi:MAG: hypothetical protein JST00_15870 [Deltaproteobacteria bacterium]|nr:hypothetical protein [Deltaproteobacteria bacterium]